MSGDLHLTVIGNLTADPELHHPPGGGPVTSVIVASTPRHYDRSAGVWANEDTIYLRCTAWRQTARHIAASLRKGDRVIVYGKLQQRSYPTIGGGNKATLELDIEDIGPSLRHRTASPDRANQPVAGHAAADPLTNQR